MASAALALAGFVGAQDADAAASGGGSVERMPLVLEGCVLDPEGRPAAGARVTSSAGGKAVTDEVGRYRLELEVPLEATSLELMAAGSASRRQRAQCWLRLVAKARWVHTDPLQLTLESVGTPSWLSTFGEQPGLDDSDLRRVLALAEYDDGTGPSLFVGGEFGVAGSVDANSVAKWNGQRWEGLGSGLNGGVNALAVHDDGSGPELFAGGFFSTAGGQDTPGVAKWNGARWAAVGSGFGLAVYSLAVHDDGSGAALYAAGFFLPTGGVLTWTVARWDGQSWSFLGTGLDSSVLSLASFDDGSGPALYAGGSFNQAGGVAASRIARWDGHGWSALGSGVNGSVLSLAVHDDGSGAVLYAGGSFGQAGGVPASRIACWDGQSWSALGAGVSGVAGQVRSLVTYDDGAGPALYAGGSFTSAGGQPANRIARWDGGNWSTLGNGLTVQGEAAPIAVNALAIHAEGGLPALFAGGTFLQAGELGGNTVARWQSARWSALGRGLSGAVGALAVFDDGSGPALHAAGAFIGADGQVLNGIAKREGAGWQPLGSGIGSGSVGALAVYDEGSGPALYAGGSFTLAGGAPAQRIARWDGVSWSALGAGVNTSGVADMLVFDDGRGPALFVCGTFTTAGGASANRIARWNGSWSPLESGMDGPVNALAVYDDGGGPALYAGGRFSSAGGVPAENLAKWNGSVWTPLNAGVQGVVSALAVHDDGNGPALFVGGTFFQAGSVSTRNLARWDGSNWAALGLGTNSTVAALASHDDGRGPALYAGGLFTTAGGMAIHRVARWDGAVWSPLGSGVDAGLSSGLFALLSCDDGRGPALFAGGDFWNAGNSGDSFLARWGAPNRSTFVLDFETEDDFATPLVNGQHLDTEFGGLVSFASSGPNAGLGIFDSSVGGPNDPSQDRDLLVESGNLLILQTENYPADANDVFPRPNDDEDGGTMTLSFAQPLEVRSVALVDIDTGDGTSSLVLRDLAGKSRTFTVPANWTGDRLVAGPGRGVLDCTTLDPQPGFGSLAAASEDAGFDALSVVRLSFAISGSGALDDVTLAGEDLALTQAAAWTSNGSGVNPLSLRSQALPVLGSLWNSTLDCSTQGPGLAVLEVRRSPALGAPTPFGQPLIGGALVFRLARPQPGAPCPFAWPLPLDMTLVGLEVHAQGLCQGSANRSGHVSRRRAQLSNAVGLRLGF